MRVNKAATQYTKAILRQCARENGIVTVGIQEYAFHCNFPFLDHLSGEEMKAYQYLFKPQGYLYGVFGGMIEGIPELPRYKAVPVARDPRDIIVSGYYSIGHSHPPPDSRGNKYAEFMRRRSEAQSSTIDEFVIKESARELEIFCRYEALLLRHHPHVHFTTYERMVGNFGHWLDELLDYCELPISPRLRDAITRENERQKPKKENVNRHLRKGRPGDYREKLKPETIALLNERFAAVLQTFGYDPNC